MNIYISGISGTGMGPLALMAKAAGFTVWGSDLAKGAIYDELIKAGIEVKIGLQDGKFLREKLNLGVDWFVYTSALPEEHAELVMARESGIKVTKRDDFTAFLVEKLGLKMIAVAGTHGKTTTTAMIVWAALKLGLPVAYIVGTTLGFAPSGSYKMGDEYFIYEADEYDRNFLKYHPWLTVLPAVSYDHPDIYPTVEDYRVAFEQFKEQSEKVVEESSFDISEFGLAGEVRRKDAALAAEAILAMAPEISRGKIKEILGKFPGVGRRFEKITNGIYTDYAHHPEEINAALSSIRRSYPDAKLTAVFQPHLYTRTRDFAPEFAEALSLADKVILLDIYPAREEPIPGVTSEIIFKDVTAPEKVLLRRDEFMEYMKNEEVELFVTLGAGDIDRFVGPIAQMLSHR